MTGDAAHAAGASAGSSTNVVSLGGHGPPGLPPANDDGSARDDAKQVLVLATAALQRERAASDQAVGRGRNSLTIAASMFAATQAAFLANVGREVNGSVILSLEETKIVGAVGVFAIIALVMAARLLLYGVDQSIPMQAVRHGALDRAWQEDDEDEHDSVPVRLAQAAVHELESWSEVNDARNTSLRQMRAAAMVTATACAVQIVSLYVFIVT